MRTLAVAALAVLISLSGPLESRETTGQTDWRTFAGRWSAAGERTSLPTGLDTSAAIVRLSGTVMLTSGEGLSRGFRGEAIGFDGGDGRSTGRAVWTDDRGDRIFSLLEGESVRTGGRVTATITGGTGRYAGTSGDYSLTWQYLVAGEGTSIQGRSVDLAGRIRSGGAAR